MSSRTLGDDLRAAANRVPDKEAVVAGGERLSYGDLDRAADLVAAGLAESCIRRGDRVALMLANSAAAATAVYGVLRAGAAIVPLNPGLKREKLAGLLAHCGAAALICDARSAATARSAAADVGEIELIEDLAVLAGEAAPARPPLSVDLAAVIYTSGSTGEPKGVTLSHANMAFVADSMIEYLEMDDRERILCVLQLSFGYGLYQLLTSVRAQATLVLETGFAFPGKIVQVLEQEQITTLPGVPTVFSVLLSLSGTTERHFPHLTKLTNAGAGLPTARVEALRRAFPEAKLFLMYGQTECQRVCYLPPDQLDARPDSVGIAIPGTEAWVESADGEVAAAGEVGELVVRGGHIMQGYWNDVEATAARLLAGSTPEDRILMTGDLFRADEEGYLYFVSRRDDIIKSRGQKVVPREIEEVLYRLAGVKDAAVVGVADELLGQAVHAHVATVEGANLDEAVLRRHCAHHLEDHLIPSRVVIHAELPRIGSGKIDRRALAEL